MKTEYITTLEGVEDYTDFYVVLAFITAAVIGHYLYTRYNRKLPVDNDRKRPPIKPGSTWEHNDD